MVILDQSKPISLYLKIKKLKIEKSKICKLHIYYSKNRNKTSIQCILKSNSISFMFNNIFCEMKGKKVMHFGPWEKPSKLVLGSVISVFTWISKYITWISKQ